MKTLVTRLLLPALALLGLSSCVDPYLAYGGGPGGYGPVGGYRGYASAPLSYRSGYYGNRYYPSSRSYYGTPYRSYSSYGSVYQPIGYPGLGLFGATPYYGGNRYYGSSSRYRGYYPNDPDDRNNPSHPDYMGRSSRWNSWNNRSSWSPRYYANDPDDRNNPSHPDYMGRLSRGNPGYHTNDPDDRNNPSHPDYMGRLSRRWR